MSQQNCTSGWFNGCVAPITNWAEANFGGCLSKPPYELYEFSPLTGIGEELGELLDADLYSEREDAVGDVLVYLANFCGKTGVTLNDNFVIFEEPVMFDTVFRAYTQLQHICLKHAQQIRAYANIAEELAEAGLVSDQGGTFEFLARKVDATYQKDLTKVAQLFLESFTSFCSSFEVDVRKALHETWDKVAARNWNTDPVAATIGA